VGGEGTDSGSPPRHLLVVTDDPSVRDELQFGLSTESEVLLAIDAREAKIKMSETVPLAVVVDLQTGSEGGFSLARDMADDQRLAQVPIILLLERPQDAWLAKQAGAAAYLVKPVDAPQVLRSIPGPYRTV
jgi:DNA-binding response OmpR family regulator